ncbi:MAG: FAD-dependent thymidylate synthase [Spirochaetia bacterium]|nr:FAD-dependent thymidylate synthase [Spirochaetia bacterium]
MKKINLSVELLHNSELDIPFKAGLMCTNNYDKAQNFEREVFLKKLIKEEHLSVIEHLNYSFVIRNISRALLQELARHRLISLSVLSTRWALKKIAKDIDVHYPEYIPITEQQKRILNELDSVSEQLFDLVSKASEAGVPNDILKYYIQESLCTSLVLTVNARELMHMFKMRAHKPALLEFQTLCKAIFETLPDNHKFMFEKFVEKS